jgi:arylsulfatase A-like enzyme
MHQNLFFRESDSMKSPNILLILADELRADLLGCFGNTICQTPNLDRLAEAGTRFDQCMITQPTCTPSRASLLTGCFPSAVRSRMVGCDTPDDPRFMPHAFKRAGYQTASIGKIHLVPQGKEPECIEKTRQADGSVNYFGFEHVDLVNGHGMHCFGPEYSKWLYDLVPDVKERLADSEYLSPGINNELRSFTTQTWTLPAEVHSGEYIVAKTEQYLKERSTDEAPFFLHVSFPDPHYPLTCPEPYASMYQPEDMPPPLPSVEEGHHKPTELQKEVYRGGHIKMDFGKVDRLVGTAADDYYKYTDRDWQVANAIYCGMTSMLDDQVGRILKTLEETGQADNTLVVFLSDHGEYMGDHGFAGKGFHYDSVIRTPLIMCGPGVQAGCELDGMASALDIAPTLMELAGVAEAKAVQGISMASALSGNAELPRKAVMTENDDDLVPMRMRTLTSREWKVTLYGGSEEGELYDRVNDPNEMNNLWYEETFQELKLQLLAQLADNMLCAIDSSNGRVQEPTGTDAKYLAI